MMFSPRLNSLRHRWRAFVTTLVVVATLVAGSLVVIRVTARPGTPAAQAGAAVPVHAVHGRPVRVPAMKAWHRPAASWPAAGPATAALTAPAPRARRGPGRPGAGPSAG